MAARLHIVIAIRRTASTIPIAPAAAPALSPRTHRTQVLNQIRRNLFQEARRQTRLRHVVPIAPPIARPRHHQRIHRPSHTDVAKPPLLFHIVRTVQRARMRKQTLLHPGQQHQRELEPLGRVESHQRHPRRRIVLVDFAHQRRVIEELMQRLAPRLRILRGVGEFFQVFNAGERFGRRLFLQRTNVPGAIDQEADQLRQRRRIAGLAESAVFRGGKLGQRLRRRPRKRGAFKRRRALCLFPELLREMD